MRLSPESNMSEMRTLFSPYFSDATTLVAVDEQKYQPYCLIL
jgi:hypothetical protein